MSFFLLFIVVVFTSLSAWISQYDLINKYFISGDPSHPVWICKQLVIILTSALACLHLAFTVAIDIFLYFGLSTHRSADIANDGVILGDVKVVRISEGGVDLIPALLFQLFYCPFNFSLGDGGEPCQGSLPVDRVQPVLVHVIEVVGANLLRSQHHGGHLMGLRLV